MPSTGLKYLTDIYDTPPPGASTPAPSAYAHHTHLFWRGHDANHALAPGWKNVPARVLGDVAVTSRTFGGTSERAIVRLYHLSYSSETDSEPRLLQSFEIHGCTQMQYENGGNITDPTEWAYAGASGQAAPCPMKSPTSLLYAELPAFSPSLFRTFQVSFDTFDPISKTTEKTAGPVTTGMFDVNGDGVADAVITANTANVYPGTPQYGLAVRDGATDTWLENTLLEDAHLAPGPRYAQFADFLPSSHTTIGNWIGDGQLNWLWIDGEPNYIDPAFSPFPGVIGTTETYSFSPLVSNRVPFGPVPGTVNNYPSPCAEPFGCRPTTDLTFVEAAFNWQKGKGFDVDGDGLQDMTLVPDLKGNQATYFSVQGKDGTITPFVRHTLQPFPSGYNVNGYHAIADMDSDGLDDIVELSKSAGGNGEVDAVFWKNRGDGRFGQNDASPSGSAVIVTGADAAALTLDPQKSNVAVGDVTGDGLADVVVLQNQTISVYIQPPRAANAQANGRLPFTLAGTIPNAAPDDAAVVALADADGSGMPDVVISDVEQTWIYQLYPHVPKPGLLRTIQNESQARTEIQYQSAAQLAANALAAGKPWQTKLPLPTQVVVDVKTSGEFQEPDGTPDVYETTYAYTDPLYDARDQAFLGFRVVEADPLGSRPGAPQANTITTFAPGVCPGVSPAVPCTTGVDYGWRVGRGRPVSTQTFDAAAGTLLLTTTTDWAYAITASGVDGRKSRMVYASEVDTYQGEPTVPPVTGLPVSIRPAPSAGGADSGWTWTGTATVPGASPGRRVTHSRDLNGNEVQTVAWGDISDVPIVAVQTWQLPSGDSTGWLYRPVQVKVGYGDANGNLLPATSPGSIRETDVQYDQFGHAITVQAPLAGTQGLMRSNSGGAFAPAPAGASADTAPGALLTLTSIHYDNFGNVTQVSGPGLRCSGVTYDSVFEELPVALNAYRDGCGNLPLTTQLIWDRGLQKVTTTIDPATAQTVTKYDPFGRIVEVDQPSADTLGGLASLPALRVDWSKVDQPNTNVAGASVHFTTPAGESYVFYDNFGRPRYRLSPAETAGSWIVSGAAQLAPTGRPQNAYVPFLWSGSDPTLALGALLPVASNNAGSYTYDALGRPLVVTGTDGATTASFSYHPLETDIQDGEQILPAGPGTDGSSSPHGGSYTAIQLDGRGQTVSVAKHLLNDPVHTITTSVTRQATGEVLTLRQIHAANASDSYARSMTYDSLGRLVLNVEPNTSTTTRG